jgi:hypothetical protein
MVGSELLTLVSEILKQPCGARREICHKRAKNSQVIIGADLSYWQLLAQAFLIFDDLGCGCSFG